MSAVLAVAFTFLALVYSVPGLTLSREGNLAAIGLWLLATLSAMLQISGSSDLRLHVDPFATAPHRLDPASLVVAPFGWAARETQHQRGESSGAEVFALYCAACHGAEGRGIEGRGLNLSTSRFVRERGDQELAAFLHEGRKPDDPRNTTGRLMPGMRNFPSFSDTDYAKVLGHLRALNRGGV